MKKNITLLLAGAVALGFTLSTATKADEAFLSPKGKANQIMRSSRADSSPNLVSNSYLGAAAKLELNRSKVVASGTTTPNLVSGNYLGAAVKAPNFPPAPVEIAPLKEKSK